MQPPYTLPSNGIRLSRSTLTLLIGILLALSLAACAGQAEPAPEDAQATEPALEETAPDTDEETQTPDVSAEDISEYGEAPSLTERVDAGELPAVAERLPANPKIIPVTEQIGQYGGTLRLGDTSERLDTALRIRHTGLFRYNFTASETQPDLAEGFEWSDDSRTLTITLREGLKWSDGEPFTTEDILFYWEHYLNNDELSPSGPGGFWAPDGEPAVFEVIDDQTISITWPVPYPIAMDRFGRTHFSGDNALYLPAHYMRQYHADFNEDVQQMAEDEGYDSWVDLFEEHACQCYQMTAIDMERPSLDSYIPVNIASDRIVLERNPYFHQVDPEGNQLPYIDRIEVGFAGDEELYNLRITSGELDFGARFLAAANLPLYRDSEESGEYSTYIAQSLRPSEFSVFFNWTVQDEELNELFNDLRFREALSMAINREQMNDVLFFGLGEVHPPTPLRTMPWFQEDWYTDALNYDVDRANELLDEVGLTETDSDGYRLLPSGDRLSIILEQNTPKARAGGNEWCELLINDWSNVGVEANCVTEEPELIDERVLANEHQAVVWHIGRATLLGRGTPDLWAFESADANWWASQYTIWLETGGEGGIEPPQEIKDLNALWNEFKQVPSDAPEAVELGGEYFSFFAEQIPFISTVGLTPQPVIVSDRLHNVPTEDMFWGSDNNFYSPFHVEQWYLDE